MNSFIRNISYSLFCIMLLLSSNVLFAQDTVMIDGQMYIKKNVKPKINKSKFHEMFTQANMMMVESEKKGQEGFIDTTINIFLALHQMDPGNANVNFKIGQLYLRTTSDKAKSVEYLEAAAPKASHNYDPDDPSEKHCPELVYKLLGEGYHLTYRFDEALAMFDKFKKVVNMGDLVAAKDLNRRIEICKTAKILIGSPINCTITNLGDSINSPYPDYGAVITADESQLFFTSRRFNPETGGNDNRTIDDKYYEDIWVSNKNDDGSWGEAKPLSTHVNTWYNEAVTGISADGQQLLYYKDDQGGSIFYSKLEGNMWSYGYMLGTDPGDITDINSPNWEPSACISPDGNTLYFVSDRPGGFGGRDIYKCVKLPTGRWSKATNLGPTINTPYDEDAPFMHPDGVTLFFSSNGHNTMGGFDVFFSTLGDSGWYPPQNMGYPINTTDDDIFYVMSTDGKRAYLSSVRPEGKGDKDIYMITIPQRVVTPVTLMKGHISFLGRKDTMLSYVTITATDLETGQVMQEVHPNSRTLKYILPLNPGRGGKTYSVKFEADGFRPHTETITVLSTGEYKEIENNYDFKNLGAVTVFGKITTRKGDVVPNVKISAKDNVSKKVIGMSASKEDGTYSFDVPGKGGESYSLTYEAEGFLPMNESLDIPSALTEYDFNEDVIMATAKMEGTISVTGKVLDKDKNPIANSHVLVVDNKTRDTLGTYIPDAKGEYYFNIQRGHDYNVSYEASGYLFQSDNINMPKDKTYSEIKKDVTLEKIRVGAKVTLNNIFFDNGKATLRKESNAELDKLYRLLDNQPNIQIEIGGYTDNKGKKETNLKLSQDRADAVVQYLILKGVDRSRLTAQGYGDAQPIAPNEINGKPNPKGMQMNRRVEFKILGN